MKKTLKEIAELVGGELIGDGNILIRGITNIENADDTQITFAVHPHIETAARCKAAAVIIPVNIDNFPKPAIKVQNPRLVFTQLLELFAPKLAITPGIHQTAVISCNALIGSNVTIMPYAVIDDEAVIGDNTVIYPHTYIGRHAKVGKNALIYSNVTIREFCTIGDRVIIHSGAVIGSDGFGFVTVDGKHKKVPQVGNVVIEHDVEIGANTAIDRATTGSTIVKAGTKIDNLVHLAHNVVIGEDCFVVAQTGIAGSTIVGNHVTFAGQSGAVGHITIGDNCTFAARCAPIGDVPDNSFYSGFPGRPHKEWLKAQASVYKLPELIKKVKELEKMLQEKQ